MTKPTGEPARLLEKEETPGDSASADRDPRRHGASTRVLLKCVVECAMVSVGVR